LGILVLKTNRGEAAKEKGEKIINLGFRRGGAAAPAGQPPPEPLTFSPEKKTESSERTEHFSERRVKR